MVVLTEKFRFIRDDVFLYPRVNSKTGKQKLVMQKINLKTNKIEFEDSIDCIHTAVTTISTQEFVDYQDDAHAKEYFYNKTLEIRSSEKLKEIKLTPKEKYIAFKSWVAGIADSGREAFRIQTEIEKFGNLSYPISNFLLRFMLRIDSNFIEEYILKIERECVYEGVKSESFIFMSLMPIFNTLYDNYLEQGFEIDRKFKIEIELTKPEIPTKELNKLRKKDVQILDRIIENPIFNLKIEFLLRFPIYIIYVGYKMESDKDYFLNCIERLKKTGSDLVAFISPILKLFFENYRRYREFEINQFLETADIIENIGLTHDNLRQIYYEAYKIKEKEFALHHYNFPDISKIPGLKYLNDLRQLSLISNNITEVKGLDHLTQLRELYLNGNKIKEIKGLEKLTNLRGLYIAWNSITKIEGLDQLKNLDRLELGENKITKIEGLDQLKKLVSLNLWINQISKIEGLDQLKKLVSLNLRDNQISKIEGLDQSNKLMVLRLQKNQILKIEGLTQLKKLISLNLQDNQISKIEGLDQSNKLQSLDLRDNQITKIEGLDSLNNLRELQLTGNKKCNLMIHLPKHSQKFIIELALKDNPIETCGYLAGKGNKVLEIYPMRNIDNSRVQYSFDLEQQFHVIKEARKKKHSLIGIYYSHPTSHAIMSIRDLEFVHDPEMFYVIVSLIGKVPSIKAFKIIGGISIEVTILN